MGRGRGATVTKYHSQRIQILFPKKLGGEGRWMDRRTCPNQFAPSTSSKLGA